MCRCVIAWCSYLCDRLVVRVLQAYMGHIQACAEAAVRDMLRAFSLQVGAAPRPYLGTSPGTYLGPYLGLI